MMQGRINILGRCTANYQEGWKSLPWSKCWPNHFRFMKGGLTPREKKEAAFSSSRSNHLSSAFQVHTVSQAHRLHICTQPPTHEPSLITVFFFFPLCLCDVSCFALVLHCFTTEKIKPTFCKTDALTNRKKRKNQEENRSVIHFSELLHSSDLKKSSRRALQGWRWCWQLRDEHLIRKKVTARVCGGDRSLNMQQK